MQQSAVLRPVIDSPTSIAEVPGNNDSYLSGVSWAAVIGGAFVSASLALVLLALGAGFGLSSVSPWSNVGATAATIGKGAIAWLILTQILASAMGGYLAGRLRTKWAHVHSDEVYFRDTAHGFLVWAVGLVITAAFLTSAAASFAGKAAAGTNNSTAVSPTGEASLNPNLYFVDMLLRPSGTDRSDVSQRAEVERILSHALREGTIPPADDAYLAQIVSTKAGLSETDAEKRVSDVFNSAQQSTDNVRRAMAHLSLWLFVALLSGAFFASYAGTIGGRQRDRVVVP